MFSQTFMESKLLELQKLQQLLESEPLEPLESKKMELELLEPRKMIGI